MQGLLSVLLTFALTTLVASAPAPEADPTAFYQAVPPPLFGVPFINDPPEKRSPSSITSSDIQSRSPLAADPRFTLLGKRQNELTNVRHVLTRTPHPNPDLVVDYTYGQCTFSYTCDGSPFGPCCGAFAECGSGWDYCAGGCNPLYGDCVEPTFMMAFDADDGDVIWDPVTDNVFEAAVGDGFLYYGTAPTSGWPSPF